MFWLDKKEPLTNFDWIVFFTGTNQSECKRWVALYKKYFHLQHVFLLEYFSWAFGFFLPLSFDSEVLSNRE
jgi:hypothetical protein